MSRPIFSKRTGALIFLLALLILITLIVGAGLGASSVSYDRLIPTLLGQGTFKEEFVLFSVRLPRMIVTLLAGMALAASGSILQGVMRNDLADPGLIGINAGAGVGVALFYLFLPIEAGAFAYLLPLAAFGGAMLTAVLIFLFAYERRSGIRPSAVVLSGVGFSMAMSGMMVILISSADRVKVDFIAKWLAGNVWGTDWTFIGALLPWAAVLLPLTLFKARALNLLAFSEAVAVGTGVSVAKERALLLIVAVGLAGSAVSVAGGISFIGLMAPHIAKALTGPRHQASLPASMLTGGWLLLLADTIGRNLADPDGVPAGIMAALIGAPYFLYLLWKK
ncbi:FecCD family ABC transporter permease [Cohnella caldifontis]|uniref:FecCD family ABC transporter permease n=1 Tax=Cohnella caldifontis TaxID=3027471 RepID=UPI0023EC310A|nr:iron ABC transporter permease [Cohnella sp. YIM B05605]